MYNNKSLSMPDLDYIDKYAHSEEINDVLSMLFGMFHNLYDSPTACWAITTIYALLQKAEEHKNGGIFGDGRVRVVVTLPEGDGYNVFDFCPQERYVYSNNFMEEDQGDGEWNEHNGFVERNGIYMSTRINKMLYISEWEDCEEHRSDPDLKLVHDQDEIEIADFSESIDILNGLSIYSDNIPEA